MKDSLPSPSINKINSIYTYPTTHICPLEIRVTHKLRGQQPLHCRFYIMKFKFNPEMQIRNPKEA
jgi:hypothetical protein